VTVRCADGVDQAVPVVPDTRVERVDAIRAYGGRR
jgi:hypothetical protein